MTCPSFVTMKTTNRSLPPGSIFPELVYADLTAAVEWLCNVFGFSERLRIGDHRSQLVFGDACVIAIGGSGRPDQGPAGHSVMLRVADVDQHYGRCRQMGAKVLRAPETYPFGERQYSVEDIGGIAGLSPRLSPILHRRSGAAVRFP